MSKKNNKIRQKQYVERLKQKEAEQAKTKLFKQQQRDANRIAHNMLDDIQKIQIKDEEDDNEDDNEDDKMDIEIAQPSRRKRRKVFRHKKSKRFG